MAETIKFTVFFPFFLLISSISAAGVDGNILPRFYAQILVARIDPNPKPRKEIPGPAGSTIPYCMLPLYPSGEYEGKIPVPDHKIHRPDCRHGKILLWEDLPGIILQ